MVEVCVPRQKYAWWQQPRLTGLRVSSSPRIGYDLRDPGTSWRLKNVFTWLVAVVGGDPYAPWGAAVAIGFFEPRVGWDLDLERLVNDLLDRGPARHQPGTQKKAVRDLGVRTRRNFEIADEAATSEMPAIDEDVKMTGLVSRPDHFKVAEVPEPTQSIVENIQSAPLIRTGYRPADLLLEKFALIAVRVILKYQQHMPAIDNPFQGWRPNVLPTMLFAEPQRVREICK